MTKHNWIVESVATGVFVFLLVLLLLTSLCGCSSVLRFAPTEAQKQNAWVHQKTAQTAARLASNTAVSEPLQDLTELSSDQSRAFVSYHGLPKTFPPTDDIEDLLSIDTRSLVSTAVEDSTSRPDSWDVLDHGLELGIGISALFSGILGTGAVRFLRTAKEKSSALEEIIKGNELFRQRHSGGSDIDLASNIAFKQAHKGQSSTTRQLVTKIKHTG